MRLFQNSAVYPSYRQTFDRLAAGKRTFKDRLNVFLADRFGATHFLLPVLSGDDSAFFTNGDDELLQRLWADERGLKRNVSLQDILLAQIEEHRAEVFYNLDPVRFGTSFVKRLPGCVRGSVAWRAAPGDVRLFGYDLVVCNFPSILASYRAQGLKVGFLSPAYDPVMASYARSSERDLDVVFVGTYSRHHRRRAATLETIASMSDVRTVFYLDQSRVTRLAESAWGHLLPLGGYRRPLAVRNIAKHPVFGLDLYQVLGRAKIVLNGAVDMAGSDRGNMRCFESLGCGALLLSDAGTYPEGFLAGENMMTYDDAGQVTEVVRRLLADEQELRRVSGNGQNMITTQFSKNSQWKRFRDLVADI